MSIEKIKTEHRVEKLEKENIRLKEEISSLKERVENLSIMFFHLKDEYREYKDGMITLNYGAEGRLNFRK